MRILVVTQYFWPERFRVNDLAEGLASRGHRLSVLTGLPNYPGGKFFAGYGLRGPSSEIYKGIPVARVPLLPRGNNRGWQLALNYLSFVASASALAPLRCREKYDVVFVFQTSPITVAIPALLIKKLTGSPVMLWVQDLWPDSISATGAVRSPRLLGSVERLVRFIYQGCDRILVTSRGFIPRVMETGGSSEKIRYFPQWAEEVYKPRAPDPDARQHDAFPPGFSVLFAGNIGVAQDFPTILAAAAKLRQVEDIHWVVVGDGRQRPWLEEQVRLRELNGTIHLVGSQPVEAMPGFFAAADVLLVTLRRDDLFSRTVPGKVQAYMACGKPIVAALEGEGARIVEEAGAGVVCPPERPDALAEAVLKMYAMPRPQREAMGASGHEYSAANFDRGVLLSQLECWIAELTSNLVP